MTYQVRMMQALGEVGRKLTPEIKKAARQALREIVENPFLGKPLKDVLSGYHSYRFLRWRIVYKINVEEKTVTVWAIDHRGTVYEDFAAHLKQQQP